MSPVHCRHCHLESDVFRNVVCPGRSRQLDGGRSDLNCTVVDVKQVINGMLEKLFIST